MVGTALGMVLYRASRPKTYLPGEEHAEITRSLSKGLPEDAPLPRFKDVSVEAGLGSFRTFSGNRSSQLPEDMGPGAAWGDFDNDGDEDLFLVASGGAMSLPQEERAPSQLYRNDGDGTFALVPDFPETRVMGMGAAWGDYDGDGWLDLMVTGYNSLILYRNREGHFERDAGFPELRGFWAGAAWGDYDGDRDLDLYVCGYVRYAEDDADRAKATRQYGRSVPYTLNPASYQPERNLLFRNEGDSTFTEVADALGVANLEGRSLGALWHDFDEDGLLDLYVANDISDNVFYRNLGTSFQEISHAAWVADYRGAMGLAGGDWNRDGDDDLFITHWIAQENALYDSLLADGQRLPSKKGLSTKAPVRFVDVADQRGLGQIALRLVGWGAEFADFDGDGWLDLIVANGSTFETDETPKWLQPQQPFLFWNRRGEHFHDIAPLDEALSKPHVGRGLALADYDDDGDLDILLMHHGEGAQLLRNEMQMGSWLKVRLRSKVGNGKALGFGDGATVIAHVAGATIRRTVGSSSYLSQSSRVVHFGLGDASRVEKLEVRWLGGGTSVYENLQAGTTWALTEGDPVARRVTGATSLASSTMAPREDLSDRERLVKFWEEQRRAVRAMKVENDTSRAIEHFLKALTLNPEHEDSLYYLANCLAVEGDLPGAVARLQDLVRINPQSHRAYKQLGILHAIASESPADLDAATEALEKSVSINPEETGSLLVLGEIALVQGDLNAAEQRLSWACRTNPKAVGGFFLRGYIAWRQQDASRAKQLLAEARQALGEDWHPEGMTSEGDVRRRMHVDETPLSRFWESWDGTEDPALAFDALEEHLRSQRMVSKS